MQNGLSMWGGTERYCGILTEWIKSELPQVAKRLPQVNQ